MLKRLLPVGSLYWAWDISWNTYPFRVLYVGLWMISHDRSGRWYERWPHISIN